MAFRIGSFNIQKFGRLSVQMDENGETRKDLDTIGRIIRENDFDIVAIQEIMNKEALRELLEIISHQYAKMIEGDELTRGNRETGSFTINSLMNDSFGYKTKHWEGRWAAPNSYYGGTVAEGYAFIWNRDRISLVSNRDGKYFEPRIADFSNVSNSLVRPPFIGRFMPIGGTYEFRIINTHIVYAATSKHIDEAEDAESETSNTDYSDIGLRKNEFNTLVGSVYYDYSRQIYDITGHDRDARYLIPYTFLLGDYNLNMSDSDGQSSAKMDKEMEDMQIDDMRVITVNKELTTLKGRSSDEEKQEQMRYDTVSEHHLANNYDHFSYDINTFIKHDIGDPTSGVIAAYEEYSGQETEMESKFDIYRSKVSDHLPIYIDFDIRKKRHFAD